MTERWEWVPGWEGYYRVSDYGRVMTIGNIQTHAWHGAIYACKPKLLKGRSNGKGYLSIVLYRNGLQEQHKIHRLVLQAFGGPPPSKKHHCHHKDFCTTHNHIDNLEWLSPSEHNKLNWEMGIMGSRPRGERCYQSILTTEQVGEIRSLYGTGAYTHVALGKMFTTSSTNIGRITRYETWRPENKVQVKET